MWINREIEPVLQQAASQRPALILTGCRQAGKTSLLKRVFPDYNYVALDIPTVAEEAEIAGDTFLSKYGIPIIIDELQYSPALLRWIKSNIDEHREENGRFLLTGSQKFSLMQGVTESLAGRCSILQCHSLSAKEYEMWSQKIVEGETLIKWMFEGGYPELHAKGLDPEMFYSDYLATYLERDVRQAIQVRSLRDFDRLMRLCASRNGQLLSYSSLATDVGVSSNTVKGWISVLEASNIIYLLEPFYQNLGKRIVKSPKLYFLDTGLLSFLLGIRSKEDLRRSTLIGQIFEAHVLGQIVRYFANKGKQAPIYFYRDHYGHEIDFIFPIGNAFKLAECKWTETPPNTTKGFEEFIKLVGEKRIISRTIVNSVRGQRKKENGTTIEDSIDLSFLQN
jgi:hypothetical protein